MKLNSKGFSLVELMVVVAIIGLLAAIAVPQFEKFQARARQSEAKSNLSAIFSAEQAFFVEWNGYATSFDAFGYAPVGDLRYNIGFGTGDYCPSAFRLARNITAAGNGCPAGGNTANLNINSITVCGNATGSAAKTGYGCNTANGVDGNPPRALEANFTSAGTTFLAGAVASISKNFATTSSDLWQINSDKQIRNITAGL